VGWNKGLFCCWLQEKIRGPVGSCRDPGCAVQPLAIAVKLALVYDRSPVLKTNFSVAELLLV
jgi:hypothetical protein